MCIYYFILFFLRLYVFFCSCLKVCTKIINCSFLKTKFCTKKKLDQVTEQLKTKCSGRLLKIYISTKVIKTIEF